MMASAAITVLIALCLSLASVQAQILLDPSGSSFCSQRSGITDCLLSGESYSLDGVALRNGRVNFTGAGLNGTNLLSLGSASVSAGAAVAFENLFLRTDLAFPRASTPLTYLAPLGMAIIGSPAPMFNYTNVTIQLPSCTTLQNYITVMCRNEVDNNIIVSDWGIVFRTWSSASITARNLNLTCMQKLPTTFSLNCTSSLIYTGMDLVTALHQNQNQPSGSIAFLHIMANISLAGLGLPMNLDGSDVDYLEFANILQFKGASLPGDPYMEVDFAGVPSLIDVTVQGAKTIFMYLTLANNPVGPSWQLPYSAVTFPVWTLSFGRRFLGVRGQKFDMLNCTVLLPPDEMYFWSEVFTQWRNPNSTLFSRTSSPIASLTQVVLGSPFIPNDSIRLEGLNGQPYTWRVVGVTLLNHDKYPPMAPKLITDTGVLRMNGWTPGIKNPDEFKGLLSLDASDMRVGPGEGFGVTYTDFVLSSNTYYRPATMLSSPPVAYLSLQILGLLTQPSYRFLSLQSLPPCLTMANATTMTLNGLVLANAAPLKTSVVCSEAARQQGVSCTLGENAWDAFGLLSLSGAIDLPSASSTDIEEALGPLTSMLWMFRFRREPYESTRSFVQLLLVNVTIMVPDLELRAIREIAFNGTTRVNLRPSTLTMLQNKLAGQQGKEAVWPAGGIFFENLVWFNARGRSVTFAPYTSVDPSGTPWRSPDSAADLLVWVPRTLTSVAQSTGPLLIAPPDETMPSPTPFPATENSVEPNVGSAPPPSLSVPEQSSPTNTPAIVGAAIGSAAGAAVLALVVTMGFVYWRRQTLAADVSLGKKSMLLGGKGGDLQTSSFMSSCFKGSYKGDNVKEMEVMESGKGGHEGKGKNLSKLSFSSDSSYSPSRSSFTSTTASHVPPTTYTHSGDDDASSHPQTSMGGSSTYYGPASASTPALSGAIEGQGSRDLLFEGNGAGLKQYPAWAKVAMDQAGQAIVPGRAGASSRRGKQASGSSGLIESVAKAMAKQGVPGNGGGDNAGEEEDGEGEDRPSGGITPAGLVALARNEQQKQDGSLTVGHAKLGTTSLLRIPLSKRSGAIAGPAGPAEAARTEAAATAAAEQLLEEEHAGLWGPRLPTKGLAPTSNVPDADIETAAAAAAKAKANNAAATAAALAKVAAEEGVLGPAGKDGKEDGSSVKVTGQSATLATENKRSKERKELAKQAANTSKPKEQKVLDPREELQRTLLRIQAESGNQLVVELIRELGKGSYGVVFLGIWRGLQVAVKRLIFSQLVGPKEAGRRRAALHEAALNASMAHPNIVATFSYSIHALGQSPQGIIDWQLFIIQEFCDVGSLYDALKGRRLWSPTLDAPDMPLVLNTTMDIACGMLYIHTRDIVHGDLKPDNILLRNTSQGVVAKVADFGMAAKLPANRTHLSGVMHGTPLYIAPEVLQTNRFSKASDVYAFGVVCWELAHGRSAWAQLLRVAKRSPQVRHIQFYPGLFRFNEIPGWEALMVAKQASGATELPMPGPGWPPLLWFAHLAFRCLSLDFTLRPTFSEILVELKAIAVEVEQSYHSGHQAAAVQHNLQEAQANVQQQLLLQQGEEAGPAVPEEQQQQQQ